MVKSKRDRLQLLKKVRRGMGLKKEHDKLSSSEGKHLVLVLFSNLVDSCTLIGN